MSPYKEEQRRDPSRDSRHYDRMGHLDPKPRTPSVWPNITSISNAGIRIANSLAPYIKADAKRPLALVTALLLAAAAGWAGHRMGKAEGFIEGSALCRPNPDR